jgi:cytochrome oxidase assembly protein ShyY1
MSNIVPANLVVSMRWNFLIKPRWLLGHLVIVAFCVLFIQLGLWQLHRLHGRQQANEAIAAQLALPPVQLSTATDHEGLNGFRKVTLRGKWDEAHTVFVRYPIRQGIAGYYVLTPLEVNSGSYLVNRGFISREKGDVMSLADVSRTEPQEVVVEGLLRDSEQARKPAGMTAGPNPIPTVSSVDLAEIVQLSGGTPLASRWIQLQQPAGSDDPIPLDPPVLDDGPHRDYLYQWIAFTILAIGGWSIVLYRQSKDEAGASDMPSE